MLPPVACPRAAGVASHYSACDRALQRSAGWRCVRSGAKPGYPCYTPETGGALLRSRVTGTCGAMVILGRNHDRWFHVMPILPLPFDT
jgi:hypothetical protein